jgi:hypothetical protein
MELLDRLHAAQAAFSRDRRGPHSWSTVGLYRVRDDRIAECWLLPLDAAAFDAIWK